MSAYRPQCRHGTNHDGAARSPLGEIVWALDVSPIIEKRPDHTPEMEEVEIAKRRAGIPETPAKHRSKKP